MREWKDVPGYEGKYQVSSDGKVMSMTREFIRRNGRPQRVDGGLRVPVKSRGYDRVNLSANGRCVTIPVHKLVALAFIGPRPAGMQVAHWNGVKTDNRVENLRYATPKENGEDAKRLGEKSNMPRGLNHHNAKLSPEIVREIRGSVGPQSKIASKFGITQSHVQRIRSGKVWTHV